MRSNFVFEADVVMRRTVSTFRVRSCNRTSRFSVERFLSVLSPFLSQQGEQIALVRAFPFAIFFH